MSERPLPRSPLGLPPADPLGTPKPAPPKASGSELEQIAKLQNLALQELREQRQWQEKIFYKLRDIWIVAMIPFFVLLLWLLWAFFSNIR